MPNQSIGVGGVAFEARIQTPKWISAVVIMTGHDPSGQKGLHLSEEADTGSLFSPSLSLIVLFLIMAWAARTEKGGYLLL